MYSEMETYCSQNLLRSRLQMMQNDFKKLHPGGRALTRGLLLNVKVLLTLLFLLQKR